MDNKYLSRYAKHDTHFSRHDQWKLAQFAEEEQVKPIWVIAGMTGLFIALLSVVIL
jgi:hypothetical protein